MRKTGLWLLGTVVVAALVLGGYQLRQREQADALILRATRLLHAPIEEVADVDQLQGTHAAQLIEQAEAFHQSTQTRLLRHTARGIELLQQRDYLAAEGELFAGH